MPKQTCPFLAFFLTPSTLSKIQAIFVAEKYGSRSSPVFLFIISSSPSFFKLLHNSDKKSVLEEYREWIDDGLSKHSVLHLREDPII